MPPSDGAIVLTIRKPRHRRPTILQIARWLLPDVVIAIFLGLIAGMVINCVFYR